jgi:hypothetical protein
VLDRLDRYQWAAKVNQVYDDEARRRLFDKISRVGGDLGLDTAADGAAATKDSEVSAGKEAQREKVA